MVFWSVLRSWCRAKVESLFLGSAGSQAMCFLVDHGDRVAVNTNEYVESLKRRTYCKKFNGTALPKRVQLTVEQKKKIHMKI